MEPDRLAPVLLDPILLVPVLLVPVLLVPACLAPVLLVPVLLVQARAPFFLVPVHLIPVRMVPSSFSPSSFSPSPFGPSIWVWAFGFNICKTYQDDPKFLSCGRVPLTQLWPRKMRLYDQSLKEPRIMRVTVIKKINFSYNTYKQHH